VQGLAAQHRNGTTTTPSRDLTTPQQSRVVHVCKRWETASASPTHCLSQLARKHSCVQ
jgi:hypothetical protein